jgi:hypothetical protein
MRRSTLKPIWNIDSTFKYGYSIDVRVETASLRWIAPIKILKEASPTLLGRQGLLEECRDSAVLEINEAGSLSPVLRQFTGYILASYPAVDMHTMPYSDDTFALTVSKLNPRCGRQSGSEQRSNPDDRRARRGGATVLMPLHDTLD